MKNPRKSLVDTTTAMASASASAPALSTVPVQAPPVPAAATPVANADALRHLHGLPQSSDFPNNPKLEQIRRGIDSLKGAISAPLQQPALQHLGQDLRGMGMEFLQLAERADGRQLCAEVVQHTPASGMGMELDWTVGSFGEREARRQERFASDSSVNSVDYFSVPNDQLLGVITQLK